MIELKLKRNISKRQRAALDKLPKNKKASYLMTFLGSKNTRLVIEKPQSNDDSGKRISIYENKGDLARAFMRKNRQHYNMSTDKRPTDTDSDWIGVEIECFLPKKHFSQGNGDCDCECNDYCGGNDVDEDGEYNGDCDSSCRDDCQCGSNDYIESIREYFYNKMIKNISIADDGSLDSENDDMIPVEIKVLTKISNDSNLRKVCAILKELKATVNKTCGLHVHLDARSFKTSGKPACLDLAQRFTNGLPILTKMLPDSRLKNNYCRYGASFEERYYMVNMTALDAHGSVEVRAHSGTTDYTKIIQWARILHAIKTTPAMANDECQSLEGFFSILNLEGATQLYIKERISQFQPEWLMTQKSMLVTESLDRESGETSEVAA